MNKTWQSMSFLCHILMSPTPNSCEVLLSWPFPPLPLDPVLFLPDPALYYICSGPATFSQAPFVKWLPARCSHCKALMGGMKGKAKTIFQPWCISDLDLCLSKNYRLPGVITGEYLHLKMVGPWIVMTTEMTNCWMRRGIGNRFMEVMIDLGLKECIDIFLAVMTDMLRRGTSRWTVMEKMGINQVRL